ncbi:hypothetical protein ACQRKX_004899, partial [Enterobacter cloacae]
DTDGHAWWDWLGVAISGVMTVVATVASLGTLTTPAVMMTMALGVAALATEVASVRLKESGDNKAASMLGWVSLGLGVLSAVPALGSAAVKGARALGRLRPAGALNKAAGNSKATLLVWSKDGKLGHAALAYKDVMRNPITNKVLRNPVSGNKIYTNKYISFYPKQVKSGISVAKGYSEGPGVWHSLSTDAKIYSDHTLTVAVFDGIDAQAITKWMPVDGKLPNFSIIKRNCTDMVSKALSRGYHSQRNVVTGDVKKLLVRRPFQLLDFADNHASGFHVMGPDYHELLRKQKLSLINELAYG